MLKTNTIKLGRYRGTEKEKRNQKRRDEKN